KSRLARSGPPHLHTKGLNVTNAAVSPDGRLVAIEVYRDKENRDVLLMDARTGRRQQVVTREKTGVWGGVSALSFSPDSKWLALGVSRTDYYDDNNQPKVGAKATGELKIVPVGG